MLNRSDTSIKDVVSYLAQFSIEAGYLVPTENGLAKSILDAHESLRKFLAQKNFHDYSNANSRPTKQGCQKSVIC
jgi:hypothetical protein